MTLKTLTACFLTLALPALANPDPGAYLAGRQAVVDHKYALAAEYFERALRSRPDHAALMENLLAAYLALGNLEKAAPIARQMINANIHSQAANMTALVDSATKAAWGDVLTHLDEGHVISPLIDGLARAWAHYGTGDAAAADAEFDKVIETRGLKSAGLYHKALARALSGNAEGAIEILSLPKTEGLQQTRDVIVARAELLSQIDQADQARTLLAATFGAKANDPHIRNIQDRLAKGEPVPFTVIETPQAALSDAFRAIASALLNDKQYGLGLLYARMAQALTPDNVPTILLNAELLQDIGRADLAAQAYAQVPKTSGAYVQAELGRAEALETADDLTGAMATLTALAASHPEIPNVQAGLGDVLRRMERTSEAEAAYTRALELMGEKAPARWVMLYTRGITRDALDKWPDAEADFRAALALRPDQPQILNYLGYSLLERQGDLDEALKMVEKAAASEPNNGAIIDSLAWALYRLGRYEDAIGPMERAVELEPTDPIVTDHLGDVLWAVGRRDEARFQWKRALSFNPESDLRARINRKMELGLDRVLINEGAEPTSPVAD